MRLGRMNRAFYARRLRAEQGVTIIELMVAITLFAFVSAGVAVGMGSALNLSRNNRNRSVAANLASAEMDTARSTDFDLLPLGTVSRTETVDSVGYSIERNTEWVTQPAATGACDSPGGNLPAYLRISVAVTWPNMSGAPPVRADTIMTPPVAAYDVRTGHIAVRVIDRNGAPGSGHTATAVGPSGTVTETVTDGCAFFDYLEPGNYNVTLSNTAGGYVDPTGVAAPTQSAVVVVRSVTPVQFEYDRSATLTLTLGGATGYVLPTGASIASIPLALGNARLPLGSQIPVQTGTASTRTVQNLYPFADGYQAWAGRCENADPEGEDPVGTRIYPTGARQPAWPTSPGGTTTSATRVIMKAVQITVNNSSNLPSSGRTVTATPTGPCAGAPITLGVTNTNGRVRVLLPYGPWTFGVSGWSLRATPNPNQVLSPPGTAVAFTVRQI